MPYNPLLFLNDYPGAITGGAVSATDAAIATLSSSSRLSALRQSDSRRKQGQTNIYLQNSGSRVIPNPMPLGTGVNTVAPSTGAGSRDLAFYFGCALYGNVNTTHRLDPVTKQMGSIGSRLISTINAQSGAVSSVSAAFVFGGGSLDRLVFSTQTINQVSATLSAMDQMPSGVGTDVFGVVNYGTAINVYTYATGVNTASGNNLAASKSAYSTAMQSPTNGYWVGGWSPNTAINKVVLSTRVTTTIAGVLTAAIGAPACLNSTTLGFSIGGSTDGGSTVTLVNKNTFASDAITASSATLSVGNMFRHGSGTSTAGFMAGGSTSNYTPYTNATDELVFGTEVMTRLGATLTASGTVIASSSTYSPGFP